MLEAWIIEELRRREREEQEQNRPELRIEIEPPSEYYPDCTPPAEEKEERGVFIIEL